MLDFNDYSIEISLENKKSIFEEFDYTGLTIIESLNQVPYYELDICGTDYEQILQAKTLSLEYQSEVTNYSAPLGVNVTKINKNNIKLYGWLTEWENFKSSNTQYLGDNIKDAILATNIRKEIKLNNNFSGGFFQVNSCNMQQCLDLCLAAADTPFWSITRTALLLSKNSEEQPLDLPDDYSVEVYAQEDETNLESENSSQDLFTGAFYKNTSVFCDGDLASCFENCLRNYKQKDMGLRYYLSFGGTTEYLNPVGTFCSNPLSNFSEVKNWVVVSVIYNYNKNGIECRVTMGGIV